MTIPLLKPSLAICLIKHPFVFNSCSILEGKEHKKASSVKHSAATLKYFTFITVRMPQKPVKSVKDERISWHKRILSEGTFCVMRSLLLIFDERLLGKQCDAFVETLTHTHCNTDNESRTCVCVCVCAAIMQLQMLSRLREGSSWQNKRGDVAHLLLFDYTESSQCCDYAQFCSFACW